jgi:hypothetical protein
VKKPGKFRALSFEELSGWNRIQEPRRLLPVDRLGGEERPRLDDPLLRAGGLLRPALDDPLLRAGGLLRPELERVGAALALPLLDDRVGGLADERDVLRCGAARVVLRRGADRVLVRDAELRCGTACRMPPVELRWALGRADEPWARVPRRPVLVAAEDVRVGVALRLDDGTARRWGSGRAVPVDRVAVGVRSWVTLGATR